jgi:hypothetical protein
MGCGPCAFSNAPKNLFPEVIARMIFVEFITLTVRSILKALNILKTRSAGIISDITVIQFCFMN